MGHAWELYCYSQTLQKPWYSLTASAILGLVELYTCNPFKSAQPVLLVLSNC